VKAELDLILFLPNPDRGILLMDRLGLLAQIIPELESAKCIPQEKVEATDLFQHTLMTLKRSAEFLSDPPNPRERYAALFHDLGKVSAMRQEAGVLRFTEHEQIGAAIAESILERLRASREEIDEVVFLVRWHMLPTQYQPTWSDAAVKRLVRRLGPNLKGLLRLARADIYGLEDLEHAFWQLVGRIESLGAEEIQRLAPPLDGEEIMGLLGEGPGPRIGQIKEELLEAVLEGLIENSPEAASLFLKRKYGLS
jgi:putative nucleotidyltransferase with HDIG domain